MKPVLDACDEHLRQVVEIMEIERIIGVGKYAEKRARMTFNAGKDGNGITPSGREISGILLASKSRKPISEPKRWC